MNGERSREALPTIGRVLGECEYEPVWRRMRAHADERAADAPDELWVLSHAPVYTLGQAGRPEHLHDPGDIPVVRTDRGGQVTYHGPGQAVVYVLVDLRRAGLGVRELVSRLEQSVIDVLERGGVAAERREGAPGVYVAGAKIAALGLRVRKGRSYHGLALNVAMDLGPFARIDPCGYRGLAVTQLAAVGIDWSVEEAGRRVAGALAGTFGASIAWSRCGPE